MLLFFLPPCFAYQYELSIAIFYLSTHCTFMYFQLSGRDALRN